MEKGISFDRRHFIGGAAAVAMTTAMGLAGCAPENTSGDSLSETSEGGTAASPWETKAWEKHAPEISESDIVETVQTDICIVGAGIAGMVAAHSAAEAGASVVLLEKADTFSSRGHDIGGVDTKFQEEQGVKIDKVQLRRDWAQLNQNMTDMNLFNVWVNKSGEVISYYLDKMASEGYPCYPGGTGGKGVSNNPCDSEYPTTHQFAKGQKTEEGEYAVHLFVRMAESWAKESGVDIRYSTPAIKLDTDSSGKVIGVIALSENGYMRISAPKGIVLATGGIGQNEDMMKLWAPIGQTCPYKVYTPMDGNTGDGLTMGIWAGGAHQKTNAAAMLLPTHAADGGPFSLNGGHLGWLTVNTNGERYFQEGTNAPTQSYATAQQPGAIGYSVFDVNYKTDIDLHDEDGLDETRAPYFNEQTDSLIQEAKDKQLFFEADTIEDLAEQIGAPADALKATVDRYNELCELGVDEDFGKPARFLTKVVEPPFYASRLRCALLVTIYGLNVNSHSQVCNENDEPIGGLYAIGNVQGNFFSDTYPFLIPGISHGRCVTFGRLLGQALAKGEQI